MQGGHVVMAASSANCSLASKSFRALPTQSSDTFARKCLAHSSRSYSRACRTTVRAAQIKPAYNKYRSRDEIDQDYIRQWKETTARDSQPRRVTPFTFLWFIPVFVKYHIVPSILKYAWWLVWSSLLAANYQIRKRLILQGAKLDVQLMKSGKTQNLNTFSKQLVLERLHGKVGILDTLKYRIAVFLGVDLEPYFVRHPQATDQDDDEDADVNIDRDDILNAVLPDLSVYSREEEPGNTDEGSAGADEPQPVPA